MADQTLAKSRAKYINKLIYRLEVAIYERRLKPLVCTLYGLSRLGIRYSQSKRIMGCLACMYVHVSEATCLGNK